MVYKVELMQLISMLMTRVENRYRGTAFARRLDVAMVLLGMKVYGVLCKYLSPGSRKYCVALQAQYIMGISASTESSNLY